MGARDLDAVQQLLGSKIVVDERGRCANRQESKPAEHKLWSVHQIQGHKITRFHSFALEIVGILADAAVALLPRIPTLSRPDGLVLRVELCRLLKQVKA